MQITERLIRPDSPNRTGNPGASAMANFNYFNTQVDRAASAHYFVDAKMVLRIIPEDEIAWHARGRNFDAIGIEPCEPLDPNAYSSYVELHADVCFRYGWDPRGLWTAGDGEKGEVEPVIEIEIIVAVAMALTEWVKERYWPPKLAWLFAMLVAIVLNVLNALVAGGDWRAAVGQAARAVAVGVGILTSAKNFVEWRQARDLSAAVSYRPDQKG